MLCLLQPFRLLAPRSINKQKDAQQCARSNIKDAEESKKILQVLARPPLQNDAVGSSSVVIETNSLCDGLGTSKRLLLRAAETG